MAFFTGTASWRKLAAAALFLASIPGSAAFTQEWCSSDNTGLGSELYNYRWQSNGKCHDHCKDTSSVAVVQGLDCWCSDTVPANAENISGCNVTCPGYGFEDCGNPAVGLYGYVRIQGKNPTTASASSSSSTTSPPQSTATTSTSDRPTAEPTTITTIITGQATTVVIYPTAPVDSNLGNTSSSSNNGGGVSTGKVVGIVLGVALGLGLLIGLAVWLWFRRRNQHLVATGSLASGSSRGGNTGIPSRQVSQMSSAGLIGKMARIQTSGLPTINGPRSPESATHDRRSLGTDQRLNPQALYASEESRMSNVSLQDNQDYSRQLRVANPDP